MDRPINKGGGRSRFKVGSSNQSLVGSVVIDAELGREDHGSIPRNCDREGAGTTWCQNWPPNQIQLVVKTKKKKDKII
jgi:hypothetical protein